MRRRALAPVIAALALPAILAACGGSGGTALAQQACTHVERSLQLYAEAHRVPDAAEARQKLQQAYGQLRVALPLAAAATSADGQWVALETTISESARVDESDLTAALQRECAVAESSHPDEPPLPTSVPTVPPGPNRTSTLP